MNPIEISALTYPILGDYSIRWLIQADLITQSLGLFMIVCLGIKMLIKADLVGSILGLLLILSLMNLSVTVTPEVKNWSGHTVQEISTKIGSESITSSTTSRSNLEPKTVKLLAIAPMLALSAGMDIGKYIVGVEPSSQTLAVSNAQKDLTLEEKEASAALQAISEGVDKTSGVTLDKLIELFKYFAFIVLFFGFLGYSVVGQVLKYLVLVFGLAAFTQIFLVYFKMPLETITGLKDQPLVLNFSEAAGWFTISWGIFLVSMPFSKSRSAERAADSSQGVAITVAASAAQSIRAAGQALSKTTSSVANTPVPAQVKSTQKTEMSSLKNS